MEYFADGLGLSANAFLVVPGGTNFAFGGARSGPPAPAIPPSLTDQATFFLSGGVVPTNALYVVEGGGNDARDVIEVALSMGDPAPLIGAYVANVVGIIGDLKSAGAQDIMLWNIPDVGKSPAIQAYGPLAAAAASALVVSMNDALDLALDAAPFGTDGLIRFDAFGLINEIVSDPTAFGFSDVTSACANDQNCIDDPTGTFFWDGIHPTTAAHALFAQAALAEVPVPATLALLGVALVGLGFMRRRKVWDRDRSKSGTDPPNSPSTPNVDP